MRNPRKINQSPPNWIINLFKWFCPQELQEGILSDLEEQFEEDLSSYGRSIANRRFLLNSIKFFKPSIIFRKQKNQVQKPGNMTINHLVTGVRNLKRNGFYSSLNLIGLSSAIAFVILAFLYVEGEYSYDEFHQNSSRIYRTYSKSFDSKAGSLLRTSSVTPIPMADKISSEIPGVVAVTRFGTSSSIVKKNGSGIEETIAFADPSFFEMFSFPVVYGSNSLLTGPAQIAISEEMATKYFGDEDPLGKIFEIQLGDTLRVFTVSSVIDSKSDRSSFNLGLVIAFENIKALVGEAYYSDNYASTETYLMANESVSKVDLANNLKELYPPSENSPEKYEINIQPLTDIHHNNDIPAGVVAASSPVYSYIFSILGAFVLLIAIFNYLSMSTAIMLKRAREIGVRRSLGALSSNLRKQFITESLILNGASILLAISLVVVLLPFFNQVTGNNVVIGESLRLGLFLFVLLFIMSIVGGLFPSSFILKNRTMDSLRGRMPQGRTSMNKIFVTIQFFLSVSLIISSIVVRNQMLFIKGKNLGFSREKLVELDISNSGEPDPSKRRFELVRNELLSSPMVSSVSATMNYTELPWTKLKFDQEDGSFIELRYNLVDKNYLKTMNIEFVEGMDFPEDINEEESNMIIVNEALVKELGLDNPLESQIPGKNFDTSHKIIGVIKDFHFSSLHNKVEPLILTTNIKSIGSGITGLSTYVWPPMYNKILVRLQTDNLIDGIGVVEQSWKTIDDTSPFIAKFVDDELNALYEDESKWGMVVNYSSIFAILISCLGLIGLMRHSVQNKLKEVGVRKIMGANAAQIFLMLSNRTLFIIGISIVISAPVTWLALEEWLATFAYRINLNFSYFLMGALITLFIALASILIEVSRALRVRPVEILKDE